MRVGWEVARLKRERVVCLEFFFCWSKVGNGDADCSFGVSIELDRMKREWKLISFHVQLWNFIDGLYW